MKTILPLLIMFTALPAATMAFVACLPQTEETKPDAEGPLQPLCLGCVERKECVVAFGPASQCHEWACDGGICHVIAVTGGSCFVGEIQGRCQTGDCVLP